MKDFLVFTVVLVLLVAIFVGGAIGFQAIRPLLLKMDRAAVEQSKSFIDSNNSAMQSRITEYNRLETKVVTGDEASVAAYKGQQKALLAQICQQLSTMDEGTASVNVTSFVAAHGGCK